MFSPVVLYVLLLSFFALADSKVTKYQIGYRLDYSSSKIKASEIDPNFSDFSNGHTSSFFFRSNFGDYFSLDVSPGAWNSESDSAQFTYQYSLLDLNLHTKGTLIAELGAGVGACIATITSGIGQLGEVQTGGTTLRKEVGLYSIHVGIGYNWGSWQTLLDARQINFSDGVFSKLNGFNTGLIVIFNL